MKFTVFGSRGFLGRRMVAYLHTLGHDVLAVDRDSFPAPGTPLGHVIYAIGLTGDFRIRPYDTVDAHVTTLMKLIRTSAFDSWLYLSSTRVYGGMPSESVVNEQTALTIMPSADSLYDLSKLLGEALCLQLPNAKVRVARLSNVYGKGQSIATFLGSLLDELHQHGVATVREAPQSCKDYLAVEDALFVMTAIALDGQHRLYNIASGTPITHAEIAGELCKLGNRRIVFAQDAPLRRFPRIDINRAKTEFNFSPRALLDDIQSELSN